MPGASKAYRLSRAADADLEDIYAYTVRTWSVRQADRYLDGVEDAIKALAAGTRSGHPRPELGLGYLAVTLGSHFIIFRETHEIFVVRILHQSRDLARHLGSGQP